MKNHKFFEVNNKEVFKYYKMFLRKHNITNTNEFIVDIVKKKIYLKKIKMKVNLNTMIK